MNYRAQVLLAVVLTCFSAYARGGDPQDLSGANPAKAAEDPNRVVVTVVDRQGNALADVYVIDCETEEQYTTDAQGQFACRLSDPMQFFYAVDTHHSLALMARLPGGSKQFTMELMPAKLVSGRVTDPNGRPVAGAQIAPLPMTSSCVLTNDQGQFDVGWLPTWEPQSGLCLMARHVERNLAAMVDISPRAARVDIQLAPALTLSGRVTAGDGAPLPGATVSLVLRRWRWGCGTPVKRAVVDGRGYFTIPALPQLQNYVLHARAPGYPTEELITGVISVVRDREEVGTMKLAKTTPAGAADDMGRLCIRIVDEDLRPVDVTTAQIWKKGSEGGAHAEDVLLVSSSTPGLYEIDQLPAGKYHALSIDVEGFARFWLPEVEVPKASTEAIICKLLRGGTIEGVVVDETGKPVMGLPVVVNSILCRRDVVTDPNGRFSASHLPDTRYSVIVEPESESPYATTILMGGASCDTRDLRIAVKRKDEVRTTTSLLGRNIWHLNQLSLPLEQSKTRGKVILLCLFDMNQRPSRNCLRQLGEKAAELEARGVIVAAIQVPTVDQAEFDKWAGENNSLVSVAFLRNAGSTECIASRSESLPWLILTDKDHIVKAEGFGLDEVEDLPARGEEMQK